MKVRADGEPQADYIVLGAGSAGCVVANRLSEDPDCRVMLLEAGGDDRPLANPRQFFTNLLIQIPAGFSYLLTDPKATWQYFSEPDAVTGRVFPFPRGKVLGGSSSINGLMYVRGTAADYNGWRQLGCQGWSWDDLLPLILRSQNGPGPASEFVGVGGPQHVSESVRFGATDAFLAACAEAGIPRDVDVNEGGAEGVSYGQLTSRKGLRSSTAAAFLHPFSNRRNLQIVTQAFCNRILFDGRRAVGVEYRNGQQVHRAFARREVILSTGAINSPKLLQLSGIGPANELAALGIDPLVDSPRVGKNLQDHFGVGVSARITNRDDSFNHRTRGLRLAGEVLKLAAFRRGVLTNPAVSVTGYVRSHPELDLPDLQIFALAASVDLERTAKAGRVVLRKEPSLTASCFPSRPLSRGEITLCSPDPSVPPKIDPQFLTDPYDQRVTVAGLRRLREIMEQPSLARIIDHHFSPLDSIPAMSDEELLEMARSRGNSGYHACGTCEMGADEKSVVDPELRVRGVDGLRVADGSIMPRIVSGNLNATCILIGEKCADLIRS